MTAGSAAPASARPSASAVTRRCAATALVLAATGVRAQPAEAGGDAGQAVRWLQRLNGAASQRSYRGTMVFSAAGVVSSSRIAHIVRDGDVFERVDALDGHLQRVYRHNAVVHTVWPQRKVVVVERQAVAPGLVAARRRVEARALAHYELQVQERGHVAGRPARQLLLAPRDGLRYARRLWADEQTALLLRSDVLAADGRVLESSAFTEVDIGNSASHSAIQDGMQPAGYEVVASRREAVAWEEQGWSLARPLPGFELVGCVRRPAPSQEGQDHHALHALFSDGLAFVSLFLEPYDEQRHPRALAAELGAMHTRMQRHGEHWVTAMGEVPRAALETLVSGLERRRG